MDDVNAVIEGIFDALATEDFHKTMELERFPGKFADVYLVDYEGERWYLKFMKEENEPVMIVVLSCNYDGYLH